MNKSSLKRIVGAAVLSAVCSLLFALASAGSASAEVTCVECGSWWGLTAASMPTDLAPGGEGRISVTAEDLGDQGVSSTVVLKDKLPAGLSAQSVALSLGVGGLGLGNSPVEFLGAFLCNVQSSEVTCTVTEEFLALFQNTEFNLATPYSHIEAWINVKVAETAKSGEMNDVSISGGGAPAVSVQRPLTVSTQPTPFGVEQYELRPENADGSIDTQAGSHPFQLTTVDNLNQGVNGPPEAVKDLRFNLPPGLVGNPTPFPQCPLAKFTNIFREGNMCPDNTVVGIASVTIKALDGDPEAITVPLFSLAPAVGEPARFGFVAGNVSVYLDTSVRTGSDYGVTVTVPDITELAGFISSRVTFWGVPGDPRHDPSRGWNCLTPIEGSPPCEPLGEASPPPLLSLPTACDGPVRTGLETDSWQNRGVFPAPFEYTLQDGFGRALEMDGCNRLPFAPSIGVAPDGQAASTPTGLSVKVHVSQESQLNSEGLAEGEVRDTTVDLPEGVALNPSAADGLQACSEEEIGYLPSESSPGELRFTPNLPSPFCPESSKVGTVEIKSPLLPNPLTGAVYLAAQDQNPFGSLFALYMVAQDPVSGTLVKLPGEVVANPVTGQLVSTFENTPQLPFEELELHFFGGERAPLSTPSRCGAYGTEASFMPWSSPTPVASSSSFEITSGPNGGPCPGATLPFGPSLTAGTTSIQAGGFSPFTMTVSREDGQQNIGQIQLRMPPGLSGLLTGVELCGEAQANAGTCGPNSLIGETTVSVGLGGDPFSVRGGKVYITGPYEGAPFGVSVVVPAKAGPYNLGQVVVRGTIQVDPSTSALTVTTNTPTQGYAIPRILDGIPLEIKHVNFITTRPGFTFNPTNCDPMDVTGSVSSVEGSSSAVAVPFQATNCATLAFAPKFAVSTSGKTSKADGASLSVKLTYPKAPFGSQANIAKVKVDLPKQLPSRLTTLQKACTAAQFEANPAGCPAASVIGHAKAITPLIPVPLEGPAYFVSHGGEAFPSLIVVLQGYGVKIDLVGTTFISKAGITSSTFKTVPDAPVGSFELTLPEGKYSALAANGNLCALTKTVTVKKKVKVKVHGKNKTVTRKVKEARATTLSMPTEFVAQNGAEIHETTPVGVSGCGKTVQPKKAGSARKARRRRR